MKIIRFSQSKLYVPLILSALLIPAERSQAVEPATVAAGAAAASVVITAIGGLSNWVDNQSDDVAAAVLAASYGKHGLTQNEEKNTGWFWVSVSESAEDSHGRAYASAWAEESAFGSWAGSKVDPFALAWTKALHELPDDHHAKGWASASVDGHVKATTEVADVGPLINNSVEGTYTTYTGWDYIPSSGVPGDVFLTVAIPTDDFLLEADKAIEGEGTGTVAWDYSIQIDGIDQFFTSVLFDAATGDFSVDALDGVSGLSESLFTLNEDDGTVMLSPNSIIDGQNYYVTDIFLDHLSLPDAAGNGGEEIVYNFTTNSITAATASVSAIPEPSTMLLFGTGVAGLAGVSRRKKK